MAELSDRMQASAAQVGLNAEQLRKMVEYADKNRDAMIDYSEFSLLVHVSLFVHIIYPLSL
jgi:hypothetical protein